MKSVYKQSLLLQQGMFKKRTGCSDLLTTVSSFLGMIWRMNLTSNMSWSALCWVRGRQLLSFFLLLDTTSSKDFITSSVTLDTSWCNVPLKHNCNIATSKILLNMVNQMNLVNSYLLGEEQNPDFFLIVLLQQFMFIFLFTWISLFTFDLHVKKLKIE